MSFSGEPSTGSREAVAFHHGLRRIDPMDSTAAVHQPTGQAHQMPVEPSAVPYSSKSSTTSRIRSAKVATMNWFIIPAPRSTPSDTSLAEMTK